MRSESILLILQIISLLLGLWTVLGLISIGYLILLIFS